jgi:hypothetical protein
MPAIPDPSALTDDDCADHQLVDPVTAQCPTMRPDDSLPDKGQCDGAAAAKKPLPASTPSRVQILN